MPLPLKSDSKVKFYVIDPQYLVLLSDESSFNYFKSVLYQLRFLFFFFLIMSRLQEVLWTHNPGLVYAMTVSPNTFYYYYYKQPADESKDYP